MSFENLLSRCEPRYVKKIKKMTEICTREARQNDAVLIVEGREGTGKTNTSEVTAAIFKYYAPRQVFMFFDLEKLIILAQNTTSKIFIWDEPALDSLTTDQLNSLNKDLMKLLMMCRVNRHFFIINITDFTKFSKYITIERPIGFVHLQKLRAGHGCYIRYKRLEGLWLEWKDKRKRNYLRYKSFFVDFPLLNKEEWLELDMNVNGLAHATMEDYTSQKRASIKTIGQKDNSKKKLKMENKRLKILIATEPRIHLTNAERANHYKIDVRQLQKWAKMAINDDFDEEMGDVPVFERDGEPNIQKEREKGDGETDGVL